MVSFFFLIFTILTNQPKAMKNITLSLHLSFDDNIDGEDIQEIADNVIQAIQRQRENAFLAPVHTFTNKVEVSYDGLIIAETDEEDY